MEYEGYISTVVKQIPPSGIRKYFDLLDETHISLGVGEPDFATPERIRQAALLPCEVYEDRRNTKL